MAGQLTLVRQLSDWSSSGQQLPAEVRTIRPDDLDELGRLYFGSYEPGVAAATLEEAIEDVRVSFAGEYGEFWWEASLVVETAGRVAAAVMTVRNAPWTDTPPGPFIIELFTAPGDRRRGHARNLVIAVLERVATESFDTVGLRVSSDNQPALRLYETLGFVEWPAG